MISPESFELIESVAVPVNGAATILDRAQELNHTQANIHAFDQYMKLEVAAVYAIYCAIGDMTYSASGRLTRNGGVRTLSDWTDQVRSRTIFMVDVLPDGEVVGRGEVGLSLTPRTDYSRDKPIVLGIESFVRKQGYGQTRYLAMNAASHAIFGLPLYSREAGPLRTPFATRRWDALVREGLAEPYEETSPWSGRPLQRYRFKSA